MTSGSDTLVAPSDKNAGASILDAALSSQFLVDFYAALPSIPGVILDVQFLPGFPRPTVAVLQQSALFPTVFSVLFSLLRSTVTSLQLKYLQQQDQ
jgi:hypothetical protein